MFNFRKSKKVFDDDKDITITNIYKPINTREEKEEEIKIEDLILERSNYVI